MKIGDEFELFRTKYEKSPRACEWGDHHFGEMVLDRRMVTLVETKPQVGTYDQPAIKDAGWRCVDGLGLEYSSNWNGPYDATSMTGINNYFSDGLGQQWSRPRPHSRPYYFDKDGKIIYV